LHFLSYSLLSFFFFFNHPSTTEIYTLSLHDALPICAPSEPAAKPLIPPSCSEVLAKSAATRSSFPLGVSRITSCPPGCKLSPLLDRKSTRLNSSHVSISYAVFCLKKKK